MISIVLIKVIVQNRRIGIYSILRRICMVNSRKERYDLTREGLDDRVKI